MVLNAAIPGQQWQCHTPVLERLVTGCLSPRAFHFPALGKETYDCVCRRHHYRLGLCIGVCVCVDVRSPWYFMRHPTLAPQLEKTHEMPPSFRDEGLLIGEGNGNPLQCSCLDNPRDGGAWWAAVSGVEQSRTRLKRFMNTHWKD